MRLLPLALLLTACSGTPDPDAPGAATPERTPADTVAAAIPDSVVTITGVVRHFDLEGGFFAIRGDDGVTYDPLNLADGFKRDGLRVRFRATLRNEAAFTWPVPWSS